METMKTRTKKQSICASIIMFVLVILMLLFVASPIQMALGMTGVLLTELILLAMAVVGTALMKEPAREVFPIHKPHARQIFGTILLWAGTYLIVLFSTLLVGYFFTDALQNVQSELTDVFTSVPFAVRFLIVAVSPAICEEAVHRGFILHFLKPVGKKWAIVLIMGLFFGLFHLDPIRFLATAFLGMALTYAALETENMFYPFLIHLINNTLSVMASRVTENLNTDAVQTQNAFTLSAVGIYLLLLCVVPWLLWAAVTLLHPKQTEKKGNTGKIVLACVLCSVFCIAGGIALSGIGMLQNGAASIQQTPTVAELYETPYTTDLTIGDSVRQQLTTVLQTPVGRLHISIADDKGTTVYEMTADKMTGNQPLELESGHYTLTVELVDAPDDAASNEQTISFNLILLEL